jgi:hypothetical protein
MKSAENTESEHRKIKISKPLQNKGQGGNLKRTKIGLAFAVIFISMILSSSKVSAAGGTTLSVVNPTDGTTDFYFPASTPVGTVFTANVTVDNASFFAAWQLNMTFNSALLNITADDKIWLPSDNVFGTNADPIAPEIGVGYVFWMVGIKMAGPQYYNVTHGTLCQINFTIARNGTGTPGDCYLHFVNSTEYPIYSQLIDPDANDILYTPTHGHYVIPEFNMNVIFALLMVTTAFALAFGRKALNSRRLNHASLL